MPNPGIKSAAGFTPAVRTFEQAADWLTPADAPLLALLRATAAALDRSLSPALAVEFRRTYLALAERRPNAVPIDPLEQLLAASRD